MGGAEQLATNQQGQFVKHSTGVAIVESYQLAQSRQLSDHDERKDSLRAAWTATNQVRCPY